MMRLGLIVKNAPTEPKRGQQKDKKRKPRKKNGNRREGKPMTICVTGGSGFLGSWCVALLLKRGHTVHTTVRSASKATFLKKLPGAGRLKVFEACDLLKAETFNAAIEGCDAVLHTASPFFFASGDAGEAVLVPPAVQGTENVLRVCQAKGVKRVALTSSTASVYANYGTQDKDYLWTDKDWSDEQLLREKKNWYCLSKVMAEKKAWEISREEGCPFTLTVLCPTLIWGPMLPSQPHLNTSCQSLLGYVDGTVTEIENGTKTVVDVQDVALAHVLAVEGEGKGAGARFLLIAGCPPFSEVVEHIRECVPNEFKANVPTKMSGVVKPCSIGSPAPHATLFDASPAEKVLGIKYTSVADMTKSMITSMLDNGFTSCDQYAHK